MHQDYVEVLESHLNGWEEVLESCVQPLAQSRIVADTRWRLCGFIEMSLESLQGWRFERLLGNLCQGCTAEKKNFPHVHTECLRPGTVTVAPSYTILYQNEFHTAASLSFLQAATDNH